MRIALVLLCAILLFSNASSADPGVYSLTGAMSNNYSLSISGISFGSGATIYKWDDFEGATHIVGNPMGSGPGGQIAWDIYEDGDGGTCHDPRISNTTNKTNSTKFVRCDLQDSTASGTKATDACIFQYISSVELSEFYVTQYMRWSRSDSDGTQSNEKWYRVANQDGWNGVRTAPYIRYVANGTEIGYQTTDEDAIGHYLQKVGGAYVFSTENHWVRMELYGLQSGVSVANGVHYTDMQLSGNTVFTDFSIYTNHDPWGEFPSGTSVITRQQETYHWQSVVYENYLEVTGDDDVFYYHDYDDIYIASSRARIEIGDNATFANCTHREIQIPTSWAANSITFTVNQGSFGSTDNAYLFVIDSDGNASDGYPVTFGQSYGGSAFTGGGFSGGTLR